MALKRNIYRKGFKLLLFAINAVLLSYCLLVAAVIFYQHPVRFDLTSKSINTLSDDTLTCLANLKGKVEVVVTYGESDPKNLLSTARIIRRVQDVLRQFTLKCDKIKIIDMVDVYQRGQTYLSLKEKYNLTGSNRATFIAGDRKQDVRFEEMADIVRGRSGKSQIGAFRVERSFTAAIRRLEGKPVRVYILKNEGINGYSGPKLNDISQKGLAKLVNELRSNNYVLKQLDIQRVDKIPDDCDILMAVGLVGPLPREIPVVENYLLGGGKLFLALNPRYKPIGLAFLLNWGIGVRPAWAVMERIIAGTKIQTTNSIATKFNSRHPITKKFHVGSFFLRLNSSRPLAIVKDGKYAQGVPVAWMVGDNIWGERNADPSEKPWSLGPHDFKSPLAVAMTSEYTIEKGKVARIVVFGSWTFLQNQELENLDHTSLLHNSLWWLRGREESIGVRETEDITRNVNFDTEGNLNSFFAWIFLAAIPGCAVLVGMVAFFIRRK